ncbi:MAG TPA: YCF48-related protein [bacterium]|nr:YCF48-related protein [bacterium]
MKNFKIVTSLLVIGLVVSGCTINLGSGKINNNNGGVFVTTDHGQTWMAKSSVLASDGQNLTIAGQKIYSMAMDPSDNKAIYLGTFDKGVIYSYDGAASWMPVKSKIMASQSVVDLAVDPKNKCQIYASIGNKLLKTSDCSRTWQIAYTDSNANAVIRSLAIDRYDSAKIYFGTDNGNLMRSSDYGVSWQNVQVFKNEVKKIVFSNSDTRIILVGLSSGVIHRTNDAGETWVDLSPALKAFKGDKSLRDLIVIPSQADAFLLATKYGLLKTVNNGDDWTEIKLLTPKQPVTINSLAVNYKNPNLIYYVTDSTFYRSQDGGENWTTTQVPTTRRAWRILTDPFADGLIYLAVRE